MSVPAKKPKKDPQAALNAFFWLFCWLSSPKKAPRKGHINIPNGPRIGKNTATKSPIIAPHTPLLLPPYFLVPTTGK